MNKISPKFVDSFPDKLEEGILYISLRFNTAVHLCGCGCKQQVVTKIAPGEWRFTYNGQDISLDPSIGNWNFKCKSHYWIKDGQIVIIRDLKYKAKLKKNRKKKNLFSKILRIITGVIS